MAKTNFIRKYSKKLTSLLVVVGLTIGAAVLVSLLAPSGTAHALDGSGGDAGGCDITNVTNHCYAYKSGWLKYSAVANKGPSDDFRDNQTANQKWNNTIVPECTGVGATSVYVFVVFSTNGNARGFNYDSGDVASYYPDHYNYTLTDGGKGTPVTTTTAQNAYNQPEVQDTNEGNLVWGSTVGWFCGDFGWTLTSSTAVNKNYTYPATDVRWTHTITNNGPSAARYVWAIQQRERNGSTWSAYSNVRFSLNYDTPLKVGAGSVAPTDRGIYDLTIPDNPADEYCQRIVYTNGGGPGTGWYSYPDAGAAPEKCVKVVRPTVSCSFGTITGDGPWNGSYNVVKTGGKMTGPVTVTNITANAPGPIPSSISGHNLEVYYSDNASPADSYTSAISPPGGSSSASFTFNTNNYQVPTSGIVTATVRYNGLSWNVGSCPGGAPVYAPYTLTPNVNMNPSGDQESSGDITYDTWITNSLGAGYPINATAQSTFSRLGVNLVNTGNVLGAHNRTSNLNASQPPETGTIHGGLANPPILASLRDYCTNIAIDHTKGFRGPGGAGDLIGKSTADSRESCLHIHNEPYVHVFGSDALAGEGFEGGACQNGGSIKAYTRTVGSPSYGSGAQFAAKANGPIQGFSSAILRSTSPLPSIGLSFANQGAGIPGSGNAANLGGSYGESHCIPDYYDMPPLGGTQTPINDTSSMNSNAAPSGAYKYAVAGGTLNIPGLLVHMGKNYVIYVNGNVHITNNITYEGSNAWSDLSQFPSLFIVAKGNILIDPNVTQLDGVYVAQTGGAGTGYIDTCAIAGGNGTISTTASSLIPRCVNQLVVNGSFVAEHVKLHRTLGSLRNSTGVDRYTPGGSKPCEGTNGTNGTGALDCAAEIFRFSPEIFLGKPSFAPSGGPTTQKYDYITSLSPVL